VRTSKGMEQIKTRIIEVLMICSGAEETSLASSLVSRSFDPSREIHNATV